MEKGQIFGKFYLNDYFDNLLLNNSKNFINNWGLVDINLPNSLTYAENDYFFNLAIENNNINTIIISNRLYKNLKEKSFNKNLVITENPKIEFWKFHNRIANEIKSINKKGKKIDSSSYIHPTAFIGDNVIIGKNVKIEANAVILDNVIIKDNVHICAGAIIGSYGLQAMKHIDKLELVEHIGGVIIHSNVKILSAVNISKGVFPYEYTEIGENTIISVHASIGHGSKIGKNCMIAGNVLISGSVKIGDNVFIGPSATIKDGIRIGENSKVLIGSVVIEDVKAGEIISGNFAYSHTRRMKNYLKNKLK